MVSQAYSPKLPYPCTVAYREGEDVWYSQIWDQEVGQKKVRLVTCHAIIGPEGVALAVETSAFLEKCYEVPNACPHITVLVSDGFESKHMGPMMKCVTDVE